MNPNVELVVLVNERNEPIGAAPKSAVHTGATPLHRGCSVFLFRSNGNLLIQQRARSKATWPLVWSNSCCGHPGVNEDAFAAARRRMKDELGIVNADIRMMLPHYRYRAEKDGIVENELCPVMVALSDDPVVPNPDEVEAIEWVPWKEFVARIKKDPSWCSPWCNEESALLHDDPAFHRFFAGSIPATRG